MMARVIRTVIASPTGLKQLREKRRLNGKTAEVIGDLAGVSRSSTQKFFTGKPISVENFRSLCEVLEVNWKEVVDSEEVEASASNRKRVAFVIEGSLDDLDPTKLAKLYAIVRTLQQLTGDASMTTVDIIEGSIRLILEGSDEGIAKLQTLFDEGRLAEVLGMPVRAVQPIESEVLSEEAVGEDYLKKLLVLKIRSRGAFAADLTGTDLSGVDLSDADLSEANLSNSNLSSTILVGADLSHANLNGANLSNADLSNAILWDADFSGAILSSATFTLNNGVSINPGTTTHPIPPHSQAVSINEIFAQLTSILIDTWVETGYGQLVIDSQRINQNKILVVIRGATHYRYIISDEEIKQGGKLTIGDSYHEDAKSSRKEAFFKVSAITSRIITLLMSSWTETGYGQLVVDSQRGRRGKIQVIIRGTTHYVYVITDEEVAQVNQDDYELQHSTSFESRFVD